jgi:hypothetical protein
MYQVGDGTAYKNNYFDNVFLMTLAAALNIAATNDSLTAVQCDPDQPHLYKKYLRYKEECSALSFVVHDGKKESKYLKNTRKTLSGWTGKKFLMAFQETLVRMGMITSDDEDDRSEAETFCEYINEYTALCGLRNQSGIDAQSIGKIAKEIVYGAVFVAECSGIKSLLETRPVRCFTKTQESDIDAWISLALNKVHDGVIRDHNLKRADYPDDACHRGDYGLQIFPGSRNLGLCCSLTEASKYATKALKVTREAREGYDLREARRHRGPWSKSSVGIFHSILL